jgi:hypothetical protein
MELENYNTVIAAAQETEWKGEWITDAGCFIMLYSRSMVNYISGKGLISMTNENTQRWVNISEQSQSTSIPVHGRWRDQSSMLDTWKVDVYETGEANLHQVRMPSSRQWFPSLSFLPWVSSQTDRSWSWNWNMKHRSSSYPGSSTSCLTAMSTIKSLFKRWVHN